MLTAHLLRLSVKKIIKMLKKQKDIDSNFMPNKPCSEGLN